MFFPQDSYARTAALRIRPVPERECCIVFTPDRPNLYTLNATAWLILELCDGQDGRSLEAAYRSAIGAPPDSASAGAELRAVIADFEQKGIVERRPLAGSREGRRSGGHPLLAGERL